MPTRTLPIALLLLAVALAGCGAFGDAEPTPTPTPSPTPTVTPTPTPPPELETAALEAPQGGIAVLRVRAFAAAATATFDGREYSLLIKPDGFWGVIGVGAGQPAGDYAVVVSLTGEGGQSAGELSASLTVLETPFASEDVPLPPEASAILADPALAEQEAATRAEIFDAFSPERLWSGAFVFPVAGDVTSPYGIGRSYNGGPVASVHTGADFTLEEGGAVAAANAGRVAFAGPLPIRGVSVIIDHGGGVFSGYHHLSSAAVAEGQLVSQGEVIAFGGTTGLSSAPHLHWEIIVRGVEVDPVPWTFEEIGP